VFAESQFRSREIEAQTFQTQGQGGQRLNSIINGGTAEDFTFNSDRLQAAQAAQAKISGRYQGNNSTIQGLAMSALLGTQGSGALQHGNLMQAFRATAGRYGFADQQREFEARKNQEQAEAQEEQFNAIKNGPERGIRTAIANRYLQNYQGDLGTQRQLGLSDEQLRGNAYGTSSGFYGKANDAGFMNEQARGAASNIIGAGGSTRSAAGNAVDVLKAGRNLDITNAGSIFGKLSGSIGSDTGSKDAFVKLLALGTSKGLDDSKYAEENRKFIESAAGIVSKSGTTSSEGLDQVLNTVGKFFGGDKTTRGIEAGQNAYELYQQKSMQQTGPTGAMRAAGIMKDPILNKLNTFSKAALFNTPENQLTSDNPQIQYWAKQAGVSAQELIDSANKVTGSSQNAFGTSDEAIKKVAKIKKDFGINSFSDVKNLDPYRKQLAIQAYGEAQSLTNLENPDLAKDQRSSLVYVDSQASGDSKASMKALEDAKRAQVDANNPTRAGDATNSANAQGDKLFNNLFSSLQTQIAPTKQAIDGLANNIKDLVTIMNTSSNAVERAKAVTGLNNMGFGMSTQAPSQQSAGPPSPSGGK